MNLNNIIIKNIDDISNIKDDALNISDSNNVTVEFSNITTNKIKININNSNKVLISNLEL